MNKYGYLTLVCAVTLLPGCATSSRGYVPELKDPAQAAQVTFMRTRNFYAGALQTKVTLDGFVVGKVGPGRYLTMAVNSGPHSLGITESSVSLNLESGEHYYFLVSVSAGGNFELERMDPGTGRATMASYTAVP